MTTNLVGLNKTFDHLVQLQVTEHYCCLDLHHPMTTLSNAPWLGGLQTQVRGILNLKVSKKATPDPITGEYEPLEKTFPRVLAELDMSAHSAGMMTAASMKSFRFHFEKIEDYSLLICVTAGLDNARRVGDTADDSTLHFEHAEHHPSPTPGTINLMMVTNAPLNQAAAVEALAIMTEAKTAACYDAGIISRSPQACSPATATGTGTDATLVAIPATTGPTQIRYCGKHTLLGEKLGSGCYRILIDTLQACLDS